MATYLVTGAAGFIASKVAAFLLAEGHTVVGIDNLNDYYDVRVKYARLRELAEITGCAAQFHVLLDAQLAPTEKFAQGLFLSGERFRFLPLDIENKDALGLLFSEYAFDGVFNLAARAGVRYSMENPFVYMTTNAMGTLNLLECMRERGVKKMVLASTSSLYAGQKMPFTEDLPVNTPISPYAASKKAAEAMAYSYHKLYGMDISVVRYFTVFGPAGRPDMSIFRFIKWIDEGTPMEIFGNGSQTRDFPYVDDIARGTIAAARPVGYEVINLGGGNAPISLNTVIAFIEKALGKQSKRITKPFHIADIAETSADISKAKKLLGWEPQISPEEGFSRSVKWYLDNREWLKDVRL